MHVVDYYRLAHSDLAKRFMSKPVLLKGGLKRRPGSGQRRRCKIITSFKNTIVFQTKLANRLAIYEEMKLIAKASHLEVVSQHIEKTTENPNDVLIFKPSEIDTGSGTILTIQPKACEM